MFRFFFAFAAILMLMLPIQIRAADAPLPEQDVTGGVDSPVLFRYSGSWMVAYDHKGFDETEIPTAETKIENEKFVPSQKIQGEITRFVYLAPVGRSVLEVHTNYAEAIEKAGFQKLFSCEKETCSLGNDSISSYYVDYSETMKQIDSFGNRRSLGFNFLNYHSTDNLRYGLYKKVDNGHETYLTIMTHPFSGVSEGETQLFNRTGTFIEIIQPKPMQTGMVEQVDAAKMQQSIAATGHISLYGIYFDTDKSEVKPESKTALDQIAELLSKNPELKLYVVGHTDSQGQLAHNQDLSKRRAEAIVASLTSTYKIAPARLQAVGLASYAPAASNKTEEGRQKNRRVELVAQ
jgi:OOP family OmpA-OmpF porin